MTTQQQRGGGSAKEMAEEMERGPDTLEERERPFPVKICQEKLSLWNRFHCMDGEGFHQCDWFLEFLSPSQWELHPALLSLLPAK